MLPVQVFQASCAGRDDAKPRESNLCTIEPLINMESGKTAIERAFELARSGAAENITDLLRMLKSEGYGTDQITGRTLRGQLRTLIGESQRRVES